MAPQNEALALLPIEEVVRRSGLRHIGFIMDGNGRWATARKMPRESGHRAGAENFKKVVSYCKKIGIRCCTVYAFSTENVKRPKREVEAILSLLLAFIEEGFAEEDIEFRFIGEPGELSANIGRRAKKLEDATRGRPCRLNTAINYGGRAEIVRAVNSLIAEGKAAVTEEDISSRLYTADCPPLDLIVRTGAEMRLSNFLLWQSAYAELYFTDRLWPDYSSDDVDAAVREFASRSRRFGGLDQTAEKPEA